MIFLVYIWYFKSSELSQFWYFIRPIETGHVNELITLLMRGKHPKTVGWKRASNSNSKKKKKEEERNILPQSNELPPDPSDPEPDGEIDDGDDEAVAPPLGEGHVAGSVEHRGRPYPVMSEAAHQIGDEREHAGRQVRRRAHSVGHGQESREHGADVGGAASEEIVGVEV